MALSLFQKARDEGGDSAALHYNIGVCQYRLGEFTEAEATFTLVRDRFPQFAALAQYNRGLALRGLERTADARAAFEHAAREGDDSLRDLARRALAATAPAATHTPAPTASWAGYLSFGAGHDDNVALIDDVSLAATPTAESSLAEIVGYAGYRLQRGIPLRITVSGYAVRFDQASQFDQEALRFDTAFEWSAGQWRIEAGPYLGETLLDGDGFERSIGAQLRAVRRLGERLRLDLRFSHDDIDAPTSRFYFNAGTRARLRLALSSQTERRRLNVAYELEENDRAVPNVSPERVRLVLGFQQRLNVRWSLDAALAYRKSDYEGLTVPRSEQLEEMMLAARHELGRRGWLLSTEYRLADNDSTVTQYSYQSRRLSLSFGRSF